jgi:hypothetical protein
MNSMAEKKISRLSLESSKTRSQKKKNTRLVFTPSVAAEGNLGHEASGCTHAWHAVGSWDWVQGQK